MSIKWIMFLMVIWWGLIAHGNLTRGPSSMDVSQTVNGEVTSANATSVLSQ